MALSFFGKKSPPAGNPAPKAARPEAVPRSGSSPSRSKSAAPPPTKSSGPRTRSAPRSTQSGEFTVVGGDLHQLLVHCDDKVVVEEGGLAVSPAAEDAAILYANGDVREAREALEHGLDAPASLDVRMELWVMLLDLLRLAGSRDAFEARSLAFATEFERSPPAWMDLSAPAVGSDAPQQRTINLSGELNRHAAAQFAQLIQVAMRAGSLRIDLTKLRSIDEDGAELLLRALRGLRRQKIELSLDGPDHFASLVEPGLAGGRPEQRNQWLALLEVLQFGGDQDRFEQLAMNYAIAYEESPPSWEPPRAPAAAPVLAEPELPAEAATVALDGEIVGQNVEKLRRLADFARNRRSVTVDCGQLRRMDFVSSGTLFNILLQLQGQGCAVTLKDVNAMICALLQTMGVHKVATIRRRL